MSEDDLRVLESGDGSHTLYSNHFQDSYHSRHGAVRESRLIYIDYGLAKKSETKQAINLLELGFGTGLNLLLTLDYACKNPGISINYDTVEAYPVPLHVIKQLNHAEFGTNDDYLQIHKLPWNSESPIRENLKITKIQCHFEDLHLTSQKYDLIYFDAFAPSKQPHLWEEPFLSTIASATQVNGILVTYCSQGKFRRTLERLGFEVERLPGPPGKREVIRATKK